MAIQKPTSIQCRCGAQFRASFYESMNISRSPDLREKIIAGELHRVTCPTCKSTFTAENTFHYVDPDRGAVYLVRPRGARHLWREDTGVMASTAQQWPDQIIDAGKAKMRVVFGMDELREKLVAEDAKIDDGVLELLKVLVINEHPVLLQRPRLRLSLGEINDRELVFNAAYEHSDKAFEVSLPRLVADGVLGKEKELKQWSGEVHGSESIASDEAGWTNIWRLSPQPSSLHELKAQGARLDAGQDLDTDSSAFRKMIKGLPRGNHLPGWAKLELKKLFDYAKAKKLGELQDALFEIRFNIQLEDDWTQNQDEEDVATLWQLLRDLPDNNVEGNTKIRELLLGEGSGGGWYSPTSHDISIGEKEITNSARFASVVRHEIGHAVHEMNDDKINGWLEAAFGWRIFTATDRGVDDWVELMGGWGSLSKKEKKEVREYLISALGRGGSWHPGPTPIPPTGHPWWKATFGPRLAYEKTGSYWYNNFQNWHVKSGYAFYLNYWYQTFMAVKTDALKLIAKMPSSYAAMSHYEFFAELYALYFDHDDPRRKHLPDEVVQWFQNHIEAQPAMMMSPAPPREKEAYEEIVRPEKKKRKTTGKKKK
ncbi:CpXC domain-containing protein [Hyphococcus sp.]|uniref:CpXC domain-containing protein n=1 Tax=Hyphococcus sp. TaxID=2038636 RepID=UPI003D0BB191